MVLSKNLVLKIIHNFSFFINILFWFLYRCNLCTFVGQNPEVLNRHKLTVHKAEMNNTSFVIPVVDLSKLSTVNKLRNLGVTSYIPVSQLENQSGQFGVPIMSFGKKSNLLDGMNATNFFNLGTIRHMQWISDKDCFEIASILVVTFAFYSIIAVLCILLQIYYVSTYSTLIWYN